MSDTPPAHCGVLGIHLVSKGRLLAATSMEIFIDRFRAIRTSCERPKTAGVDLQRYRCSDGARRAGILIPEKVQSPLGDAIRFRYCDLGISRKLRTGLPEAVVLWAGDAASL